MSVVVTGGASYVGSHVVLELIDAGEKVTVLDDLSTGFECAVPKDATFVRGDIGDANLVARILRQSDADAIFHFAGSVGVPDSVRDPLRYYLNNSYKSRTLIESAIKANVKSCAQRAAW